jgi:dTDP-4-dehydrorhamnose 3,5-epimerase
VEIIAQPLAHTFVLQPDVFRDGRGYFVKTYQKSAWTSLGLDLEATEHFHSLSWRGVIRGMHFQVPPHANVKVVSCVFGAITDVLLDVRPGPDYGKYAAIELSASNAHIVLIPEGVAHGFLTKSEEAVVMYKTTYEHVAVSDRGIRWDSFGYDWGIASPTISERDQKHLPLSQFESPFNAAPNTDSGFTRV